LETRIAVLEERSKHQDARLSALEDDLKERIKNMETKMEEISKALGKALTSWNNRPSWLVTLALTALSTLATGLIIYVAKGGS
jgi:uncharacterized coiled-coil protein SlyX